MKHRRVSVGRDLRSAAGVRSVHDGWQLHDWAGERIGEVVDRDQLAVSVRIVGAAGSRVRIPIGLIAAEDEAGRRATLAVVADELEGLRPLRSSRR